MTDPRASLREMYQRRGALTASIVEEEASDPRHALHDRFEWDDTIAGHRYRLIQAQEIIRSVRVTYAVDDDGQEKTVRAYVSVRESSTASDTSGLYEPVEDVLADGFRRRVLLAEFEREWKAFRARYSHLAEFAEIVGGGKSGEHAA